MKRAKKVPGREIPIPYFKSVAEVYSHHTPAGYDTTTMIMPDPMAGRRRRFTVVRLTHRNGEMVVIGRELTLGHARKIAQRPKSEDGKPSKRLKSGDAL